MQVVNKVLIPGLATSSSRQSNWQSMVGLRDRLVRIAGKIEDPVAGSASAGYFAVEGISETAAGDEYPYTLKSSQLEDAAGVHINASGDLEITTPANDTCTFVLVIRDLYPFWRFIWERSSGGNANSLLTVDVSVE